MKWSDREQVSDTVSIGKRVLRSTVNGVSRERVSSTYTAEYTDASGRRRFRSLGTSIKKEARLRALALQQGLSAGQPEAARGSRLTVPELIARFDAYCVSKNLAPRSLAKYRADLAKLAAFCAEHDVQRAARFDEETFHRFGAWLRSQEHKQGGKYQSKTLYTALTITKSLFKYGWRVKLLPGYELAGVSLPVARARPQPCFTLQQVEVILDRLEGDTRAAFAVLCFTGLRIGELVQLRWSDVHMDRGDLGMIHVQLGGSAGTTKDKDARFVPVHPRIRPLLESLPRTGELVVPGLKARTLLGQVKRLCRELGYDPRLKVHSTRHFFASMCANNLVSYRMALAWLGHSSSDMLALYYHLSDADSAAAMRAISERTTGR